MKNYKISEGYIPHQLDVLSMIDEPHIGREAGSHNPKDKQHNRRPFLIISSRPFNNDDFVETMPITSHRHLPTQYNDKLLPIYIKSGDVHGYIAAFQILGRDALARDAILVGKAKTNTLSEIRPYFRGMFTKLLIDLLTQSKVNTCVA